MESLLFMMGKTLKNHLLELRKKPLVLFLYAIILLMLLGVLRMSSSVDPDSVAALRMNNADAVLQAGAFALVLFLVGYFVSKGLDTGGSFFSMADANLLFTAPISPANILTYGMVKQATMALVGGIVILAQAANLRNFFGIGGGGTLVLFVGYVLSMIASEGLAMLIYGLTNGRKGCKALVMALCAAIVLPLVVMAVPAVMREGLLDGLVSVGCSFYATLIPIAGWSAGGVAAFVRGDFLTGSIYFGLNVLLFFGSVALFSRHGSDYYEDVLVATEASTARREAQSSGDVRDASALSRRVKVKGTGLFGWGASAIMGRQLRESFRLNPLKLLDTYSLSVIAMGGIMAYMNRGMGTVGALTFTFFITLYMQLAFMTISGPLKELTTHYIFLIPVNPVLKLIWNNGAAILKAACESVVTYIVIGVILKLQVSTIVAAAFANLCFCIMLFAINVWGLRFFGTVINRGIMLIVYVLIAVVALLPGAIPIIIVAASRPIWLETMVIPALLLGGWTLAMALLFTFWSRNVLHNIDMITIQVKK